MLVMMIPSLNRIEILCGCLDSIAQVARHDLLPKRFVIMACLQGFNEADKKHMFSHYNRVMFASFSKALGPGGARKWLCDEILKREDFDPILSFDDDTVFTLRTNVVEAMKLIEDVSEGIGIVQFTHDSKHIVQGKDMEQHVLTTGGGNLFRREVLERTGGYRADEYLDDMEFSARTYIMGYKNIRTTRAMAKTRQNRKDGFQLYYKHNPAKTYFWKVYGEFLIEKVANGKKREGINQVRIPKLFTTFNKKGKEEHERNRKILLSELKFKAVMGDMKHRFET